MHITILPVIICTFLIIAIWPMLYEKISHRFVLLFFSLACAVMISPAGTVLLLIFSLLVFAGGKILPDTKKRSVFYVIISLCLLPLVLYKFFDAGRADEQTVTSHALIEIIGISYFSFNGLSYLFDIRKGYLTPEKNYSHLLLFLCYFPCIAAGPLHRYKYLNEQFANALPPNAENFSRGFRLILWGLFKNLVLAQRFKAIADIIFDSPGPYTGIYVLFGGLAFFFQLYCDFSGYVDIGMGFSRMLGIQLTPNFSNRVYLSSSRTDFWKGWHQTLNTWFRDYFFFPLVKGQARKSRIDLMMLLTFLLIGLWHEISWKFLFWGLLNGLWILAETKIRERVTMPTWKVLRVVGILYHLSLASFMAVIFRTTNLTASWAALFSPAQQQFDLDGMFRRLLLVVPLFLIADWINRSMKTDTIDTYLGKQKRWQRWSFYFLIGFAIMAFGMQPGESHYYTRF